MLINYFDAEYFKVEKTKRGHIMFIEFKRTNELYMIPNYKNMTEEHFNLIVLVSNLARYTLDDKGFDKFINFIDRVNFESKYQKYNVITKPEVMQRLEILALAPQI